MTTYIVGLDGSEHAHAALDWALAVAAADEKILVAHAWDMPVTTGYEAGAVVDPLEIAQVSDEFLANAVAECDDPRVEPRLLVGNAGRAIVDLADEVVQDVTIVVGHSGTTKVGLLLGSTAHHVIHHSEAPVVVVRGELRLPVRRVVVGVDQGHEDDEPDDRSIRALRWALGLAGAERVEVSHADFVPAVAAGPIVEPGLESEAAQADDDALVRHAIEQATDGTGVPPNGAQVVPVVGAGTGAFSLIEASREADLVVVGTRARRALVELVTGSTSLDVLAHAHCPVAVIR
ncbi:MAG: universal stress protein [Ilumatobacteraceae bacterium]